MTESPLLSRLLANSRLPEGHPLGEVDGSHPMAVPMEYFLSLEGLPGFQEWQAALLSRLRPADTTNARFKDWTSICAEIGAASIVGQALGLPIVGFEPSSPRRKGDKKCDIEALDSTGERLFFEVKRNQKEDSQELPKALADALEQLEGPFSCTATLLDREYTCSDLDDLMTAIRGHVDLFLKWKQEGHLQGQATPPSYSDHRVEVIFHDRDRVSCKGQYFQPLEVENLCAHLLESGHIGESGDEMIPMVKRAMDKGADYLMYRASAWEPLDHVVEKCFRNAERGPDGRWFSSDERLGSLSGVIIFERYDRFIIIESRQARHHLTPPSRTAPN